MLYQGILDYKKMPKDALQGYVSWKRQRDRCNNSTNKAYKYYGSKGTKVLYSQREFIGWWLRELKSFRGKVPTVSRIDHYGNYCFGNIKLEDLSDNVKERNERRGNPNPPRKILCLLKTGQPLILFNSVRQASRLTGMTIATIIRHSQKKLSRKSCLDITFEYYKGVL